MKHMGKYDDMLNLPHWEPKTRRRMSDMDRAAQFASFAALTGYDEMVSGMERDFLAGFDDGSGEEPPTD